MIHALRVISVLHSVAVARQSLLLEVTMSMLQAFRHQYASTHDVSAPENTTSVRLITRRKCVNAMHCYPHPIITALVTPGEMRFTSTVRRPKQAARLA